MKPSVVMESLRLTYDTLYMNEQFTKMLEGAFPDKTEEEKTHLTRFLFEGFSFNHVMRWQPHKDWTVAEVKEFLQLYTDSYKDKRSVFGYAMVEDFFKQLGKYTAEMEPDPKKDDWPFWFLAVYYRPVLTTQ